MEMSSALGWITHLHHTADGGHDIRQDYATRIGGEIRVKRYRYSERKTFFQKRRAVRTTQGSSGAEISTGGFACGDTRLVRRISVIATWYGVRLQVARYVPPQQRYEGTPGKRLGMFNLQSRYVLSYNLDIHKAEETVGCQTPDFADCSR
jgi:hypothetical protein